MVDTFRNILADRKVRYVGEPVLAIIAKTIEIAEEAADMSRPTTGGFFLDDKGGAFINTPDGLIYDGEYNPDIHGLPVPLAKGNNNMLIAGGKKSDEQRAYEDFVKDSGSQPLDEQLMDMDKGRMGGGLDILDNLLFNDTV